METLSESCAFMKCNRALYAQKNGYATAYFCNCMLHLFPITMPHISKDKVNHGSCFNTC